MPETEATEVAETAETQEAPGTTETTEQPMTVEPVTTAEIDYDRLADEIYQRFSAGMIDEFGVEHRPMAELIYRAFYDGLAKPDGERYKNEDGETIYEPYAEHIFNTYREKSGETVALTSTEKGFHIENHVDQGDLLVALLLFAMLCVQSFRWITDALLSRRES